MPEAILQQKLFPYDGAFDATKHPLLISPKDVVDSNNVIYTNYSTKKKRPGISEAFSIPGNRPILSGIDFHRLGRQYVVVYNGSQILAIDPLTGNYDDISLNFTVPIDDVVSFSVFSGLLLICFSDPSTKPKAWVGSGQLVDLSVFGVDVPDTSPFCRVWLNKLWMPDPLVQGRVLHSNTGTVDFSGGNAGAVDLDINDNDPDGITSIFPPFFGSLYITKRFSTFRLSPVVLGDGTIIFSQSKISDGIGCLSHNAVVATTNTIVFPSDEGIHFLKSTDKISEIDIDEFSSDIAPLWVRDTNFSRMKYAHGVYDKQLKSYLLLYPSESNLFPNDVWGYSLVAQKWYRWRNYNQTSLFTYTDSIQKKIKTIVCSKNGRIGFVDTNAKRDYEDPISLYFRSGIIGSPDDRFSFVHIIPIFKPQKTGYFKITYKIDGRVIESLIFDMQDSSLGDELGIDFILGQSVLGGLPKVVAEKRSIMGYGMMYEFIITHTGDSDEDFEMLGILLNIDRVESNHGRTVA